MLWKFIRLRSEARLSNAHCLRWQRPVFPFVAWLSAVGWKVTELPQLFWPGSSGIVMGLCVVWGCDPSGSWMAGR